MKNNSVPNVGLQSTQLIAFDYMKLLPKLTQTRRPLSDS